MARPNYFLTSHSPYRWKPELVGLTTPLLMESEDAVLPLPMCHALPLIGTSEAVKQVDIFREANEELLQLGQTGNVFKEEFVARDGDMLANMKIEADNVGQKVGRHLQRGMGKPKPATRSKGQGCGVRGDSDGQWGLRRSLASSRCTLGAKSFAVPLYEVPGSVLGEGWVRPGNVGSATTMAPNLPPELQTVGVEHAFSCFMPVNLNCPSDGRENMFVYGSGSGVPYPWHEVSMNMAVGDLWILSSSVIHRAGEFPRDAPP